MRQSQSVAALECFERWGQAGPDTSQVGPMWSGSGKYILVWGRGEARGGLWGLSPPKFVKVSPSITEDEYIYTIRTQLKYCRLRLIGTPVNRDNRLTGTTPKNKIFSIEANTKISVIRDKILSIRTKSTNWVQILCSLNRKFILIRTNSKIIFLIISDKGITKYLNRVYCLIDFRKIAIYQKL